MSGDSDCYEDDFPLADPVLRDEPDDECEGAPDEGTCPGCGRADCDAAGGCGGQ